MKRTTDFPSPIRASHPIRQRAKELRREQTPAEALLWKHLRAHRFAGYKFRRQHPIDRFIADFYCAEKKLIIEVDGDIHDLTVEHDAIRSQELQQRGYCIVRFTNEQITTQLQQVLRKIHLALTETP